ncbi:SDR family oxidoreductase [Rhizobium sp. SG2393]|uniref:SDR family oxidoreductase n=1 Tax=Rhizobium sp. SG2393 TaxID=3276279 RepID=UPI003670BC64
MAESLSGKVVAITGAASGIGLACAKACVAEGATVFFVDRAEEALKRICAEVGRDRAIPLVVDLLDPESVRTMVPAILARAGRLDVFHANAGTYIGGDLVDGDPDAFDKLLNLNVNAVFRTVHAVLPHMIERQTGDIVVTTSVAGHEHIPWEPVYSASKHAVQTLVYTLRRQVAKHGIRVGSIAPGPVITALLDDWLEERLEKAKAAKSLIEPEEIADVLLFMLSRPRHITIRDVVILPASQDI